DEITDILTVVAKMAAFNLDLDPIILLLSQRDGFAVHTHSRRSSFSKSMKLSYRFLLLWSNGTSLVKNRLATHSFQTLSAMPVLLSNSGAEPAGVLIVAALTYSNNKSNINKSPT